MKDNELLTKDFAKKAKDYVNKQFESHDSINLLSLKNGLIDYLSKIIREATDRNPIIIPIFMQIQSKGTAPYSTKKKESKKIEIKENPDTKAKTIKKVIPVKKEATSLKPSRPPKKMIKKESTTHDGDTKKVYKKRVMIKKETKNIEKND